MNHESCRKKELAAYAKGLEEGKRLGKAETYEEVLRAAEEEILEERPCQITLTN